MECMTLCEYETIHVGRVWYGRDGKWGQVTKVELCLCLFGMKAVEI